MTSPVEKLATREQAILNTLRFFAIWQHPLMLRELKKYLLHFDLSEPEIKDLCTKIPEVVVKDGFYSINSQLTSLTRGARGVILDSHPDPFTLRQQRKPLLKKRLKKANRFLPLLRFIPFVRSVYVCNNLSFGIATATGDIDLLIITEKNHIFLARFLTTIFLHLLGVRRHGNHTTDRFCLSFYITEDNLDFSPIALRSKTDPAAGDQKLPTTDYQLQTIHDPYLAYWTYSLLPIFEVQTKDNPQSTINNLQSANFPWLQNYFHMVNLHEQSKKTGKLYPQNHLQKFQESLWKTTLGIWLDHKLTQIQKDKIIKSIKNLPNSSGIIISDNMLKFHGDDRRREYQIDFTNNYL